MERVKGLSATLLRNACSTALIGRADRRTPVRLSLVVEPSFSRVLIVHPQFNNKKTTVRWLFVIGAGEGIRTLDINLGKVALYP